MTDFAGLPAESDTMAYWKLHGLLVGQDAESLLIQARDLEDAAHELVRRLLIEVRAIGVDDSKYTWAEIGEMLGTSKQAAQQLHARAVA